jgi:hypothetical protein
MTRSAASPFAAPGLQAGRRILACSRLLGTISACIFFVAALAVVDGLQTLMRREFNAVALAPGESAIISGVMPRAATRPADLTVSMEGLGGVTFTPVDAFKGFWMGGDMWRAELTAGADAQPGKGVLTVVDMVPLKKVGQTAVRDEGGAGRALVAAADGSILGQNPALVYSVTVWLSADERNAAELSLLRRMSGLSPFAVAGVAAACAVLFGIGNFLAFTRAEALLARQGVYVIHGVRRQADGVYASFAHTGANGFAAGDAARLFDLNWREQSEARIVENAPLKGVARCAADRPPRYGWLLLLEKR